MLTLKQNALLITLPILLAFSVFAYLHFTSYAPLAMPQSNEVKGIADTKDDVSIPQPTDAVIISDSITNEGYQTTIKTKRDFNRLYSFYISVLSDKGWEEDNQDLKADSYIGSYKKGEYKLNLSIFKETVNTGQETNTEQENIVSLDVYKE